MHIIQDLIDELIDFLENNNTRAVFSIAFELGWITQEEFDQSLRLSSEDWWEMRKTFVMFILLAEGYDF